MVSTCTVYVRNTQEILVGKPEGKTSLGRNMDMRQDNIKKNKMYGVRKWFR